MKPISRALIPILCTALFLTGVVTAQTPLDDPDIDLYGILGNHDRSGRKATLLDMDVDSWGTLVVAFVDEDWASYGSSLIVASRHRNTGKWTRVANFAMPHSRGRIKDLSLDVGVKLGGDPRNRRAYVAVVFETDPGVKDELRLFNGPIDRGWNYVEREGTGIVTLPSYPAGSDRAPHPSVAVIPQSPDDFADYAVGVAYTDPTMGPEEESGIMLCLFQDYPGIGWSHSYYQVAGPGSDVLDGDTFGRPSLASDDRNAYWAVAFEDYARQQVHVVNGTPEPKPTMQVTYATDSNDNRHHPTLAAHRGEGDLSCLGDAYNGNPANGYGLHWYHGRLYIKDDLLEAPPLHDRCRTPADIGLRRDDAFVTADCRLEWGEGWGVHAFEGLRTGFAPWVIEPINDYPADPYQPRAVVTTPGANTQFASYGYCTEEEFPYGQGIGKAMFLDP